MRGAGSVRWLSHLPSGIVNEPALVLDLAVCHVLSAAPMCIRHLRGLQAAGQQNVRHGFTSTRRQGHSNYAHTPPARQVDYFTTDTFDTCCSRCRLVLQAVAFSAHMSTHGPSIELGRFRSTSGAKGNDYAHLADVALETPGPQAHAVPASPAPSGVLTSEAEGNDTPRSFLASSGADGIGVSSFDVNSQPRDAKGAAGDQSLVARLLAAWNAPSSSVTGTVFNVTNTVIGAGILAGWLNALLVVDG